jgi:hypothetical protein
MRQAVLYLRVSTIEQTTANQERELREIASRMGCEIVKVYRDHGISGAKGRDRRPAFDKLCRDAARREFDMVMAWSVDRLGRSLQDLVGFLSELHALRRLRALAITLRSIWIWQSRSRGTELTCSSRCKMNRLSQSSRSSASFKSSSGMCCSATSRPRQTRSSE